ncbi:hypothetical protein [Bradyrhizobium sp. Gha]|uniref:hypothetical protein n=1 Tax=Bradyrhizobium sp. Gha TaxID=1855318 RepID=UPI0011601CAD|nr:hypothetical protein [Bradyrhizobium sp. Gha]
MDVHELLAERIPQVPDLVGGPDGIDQDDLLLAVHTEMVNDAVTNPRAPSLHIQTFAGFDEFRALVLGSRLDE